MRFIHTADWHLGRLFYGRHMTDDQAYVLEQFHQIVREAKPDVILICGDIYDRGVPPTEAVELLDATLARLSIDIKAPVILIAGNHDSPERISFGSKLLERQGVYVRGTIQNDFRPVVLDDAYGSVYFLPYPYAEAAVVRNIWPEAAVEGHEGAMAFLVEESLRRTPSNVRKVALAHAFVAGGLESESERPLNVGGSSNVASAIFQPFHYTALGHLHHAQQAGGATIRYSGSLMKYSFDEVSHKKGVEIIDLAADGSVQRETIPLTPRYDLCKIKGKFTDLLENRTLYPATEDYMAIVLEDTQAILDAHGQLAKIYPRLMQLERPNLGTGGVLRKPTADYRTRSEAELFADFFLQMTGASLDAAQQDAFRRSYEKFLAGEREVKL